MWYENKTFQCEVNGGAVMGCSEMKRLEHALNHRQVTVNSHNKISALVFRNLPDYDTD